MIGLPALAFPWALLAFQAPPASRASLGEVEELWRTRCLACHVSPDPRFATERAWITQIADTTCGDTPPEARASLIEYLESKPLPLPEVVDGSQPAMAGQAMLLPNFKRGAALLRTPDGRVLRLSWDEPTGQRGRAVPPGRYELLAYRLMAEGEGTGWHVSGSGLSSVTLDLSPGGTHVLAIDPIIRLEARARSDGLQVAVLGHEQAGLSIYQDGKRVPIRFRRLDRSGQVLVEGKLQYGSGGGGWAPFEPDPAADSFEVLLETPPFPVRHVRR